MKYEFDWLYMRKTVVIFVTTIIACACLVSMTHYFYNSHTNKYYHLKDKINQLKSNINLLTQKNTTLANYQENFGQLIKKGIIEHEHRLKWVSAFRKQANQLEMQLAKYQIMPQTTLKQPGLNTDQVQLFVSRMLLTIHMLHEIDLIRLLKIFDTTPGLYHLNACRIHRTENQLIVRRSAVNFIAECEIHWYTLKPQRNTEGTPE